MNQGSVDFATGLYAKTFSEVPFIPGATVTVATSTTPITAVAVTAGQSVRFSNAGADIISLCFGTASIAGTITVATAMDIMPSSVEAFTVPVGATHFSAVMATGSGSLKYTLGVGG